MSTVYELDGTANIRTFSTAVGLRRLYTTLSPNRTKMSTVSYRRRCARAMSSISIFSSSSDWAITLKPKMMLVLQDKFHCSFRTDK